MVAARIDKSFFDDLEQRSFLFDLDSELDRILRAPNEVLTLRLDNLDAAAVALKQRLLERFPIKTRHESADREEEQKKKVLLDLSSPKDRRGEYASLANTGKINPRLVRFSQSGCTAFYQQPFRDNEGGEISGYHDHVAALKNKKISPDSTPAITITCYNVDGDGETWEIISVDNRRLKVHREANELIKYIKVDWDDLTKQQQDHFDGKASDNLNVR